MQGFKRIIIAFVFIYFVLNSFCFAQQKTKYLVVIGVDGLSSWGLKKYQHKTIDSLMKAGSYTLSAKATMPTLSAPNWVSIITGVKPSQHGVKSNKWKIKSTDVIGVPTFFKNIKQKDTLTRLAIFHQWKNFAELVEHDFVDTLHYINNEVEVMKRAGDYLIEQHPSLTFIHLDHVDSAGHNFGLKSVQYKNAIKKTDSLIEVFINKINKSELKEQITIIITSDHGFSGKHHGGFNKTERNIPLILAGAGIKKGKYISTKVYTQDTALLIEYLFAVKSLDKRRQWMNSIID